MSIGASAIAVAWEPNINEFLGTSSTEQVTSDESNPEELYTYVNEDITNTDDLVAWHKDLAEREQEEGSVLLKNNNETLPLANGAKVTLLGNRSRRPDRQQPQRCSEYQPCRRARTEGL